MGKYLIEEEIVLGIFLEIKAGSNHKIMSQDYDNLEFVGV